MPSCRKFQDGGLNSTLTDSLHDAYLLYPRSPCLHQCLGHDIHRKRNHPDKKGSDLNNSAERIENGGKLSRWYNHDCANWSVSICCIHTCSFATVISSRFSILWYSRQKSDKKKDWFRSLRWTFTHASLSLELLDFSRFSGSAVRLINYMRGTFMKNKVKIVTATVAELRETEKFILKE